MLSSFRAGEQLNRLTNICEKMKKKEKRNLEWTATRVETAATHGREQPSALVIHGNTDTGQLFKPEVAPRELNLAVFCVFGGH
jgi:hypothetical protein